MKMVLAAVAAIVGGLALGSLVSGNGVKNELLAEAAQHAADSTAATHASEASEHGGSGLQPAPAPAVTPAAVAQEPDVPPTIEPVAAPPPDPAPVDVVEAPVVPTVDPAIEAARVAEEGAQKLAQIFGAMQAEDAAGVLQEMDDSEIELILGQMNNRLAAQILGLFDTSRAAALSRAVLGTPGGGQ